MSEYQYYEFRAIDRPLDDRQRDELRRLSTRAEITPTSFTNTYQWGDFKGNPRVLMQRYFDAFVYVANWGTHRLMFRIPRRFIDVEAVEAYATEEGLSFEAHEGDLVIDFLSQDEGGDEWSEGERWMSSLIPLRAELMRGDYRALYLGWLASAASREQDDDELEPPVPAGLAKLSAPLRELAEFLRVDDELIEVAAVDSDGEALAEPSHVEMADWIRRLPAAEKDAYLLRFVADEGDLLLRAELSKRFREETLPRGSSPPGGPGRRTVGQILADYDALVAEKQRKEADRAAKARARREQELAEAREKHLDHLARREEAVWREVEKLIDTKVPKSYDQAVAHLVDLRDLARRSGRGEEADARIRELRRRHSKKPSLLERFDKKGLAR